MINHFKAAVTAVGFNSVSGTGLNAYYEWIHTSPEERRIQQYDPEGYLGTKGLRFLNRATLMYCNIAYQCIRNRQLEEIIAQHSDRVGLYDGTDLANIEDGFIFDLTAKMDGADLVSPMSAPNTIANASSSMMAIKSAIKGPNFTVCGGACGSFQALDIALLHLSQDMIDYAVVGSTEVTSKYHEAVRQGEHRGVEKGKLAPEMGFALTLESYEKARQQGVESLIDILGVHSGQQLRQETPEGLLIRLIKQVLQETEIPAGAIDGIIVSAGSHNLTTGDFGQQVASQLSDQIPVFYPESIHGHGDNAGGFAGIFFGIGLCEGKIKTTLSNLYVEANEASLSEKTYQTLVVVSMDRTGYGIVTLISK